MAVKRSVLVTFVPPSSELFRANPICRTLFPGSNASNLPQNKPATAGSYPGSTARASSRNRRLWRAFEGLAHTLDLTPTGVRLGAIRHQLKVLDTLTIFYHQRRMEFTVVWTKLLDGRSEYQVGLQAFSQEKDTWGTGLFNSSAQQLNRASAISGAA